MSPLRESCLFVLAVIMALCAPRVRADTLAHWEADDTPGAGGAFTASVTTNDADITASAVRRDGTSLASQGTSPSGAAPSGNPVFRQSGWGDGTPTHYYQFQVFLASGKEFVITNLQFYGSQAAASRTGKIRFDCSVDGGAFAAGVEQSMNEFGMTLKIFNTNVTASSFVTVRLYAWAFSAGSGATFAVDDIKVLGYVTPGKGEVTIAEWEADDTPGAGGAFTVNVTTAAPGVTASSVLRDGSTPATQGNAPLGAAPSGDPVFRQQDWEEGTPTHYYEFDIDLTGAASQFVVKRVRFYGSQAAAGRTGSIRIDWNINGQGFQQGTQQSMDEFGMTVKVQDLYAVGPQTVVFRLYAWAFSAGQTATFAVDDIRIDGELWDGGGSLVLFR